MIHIIENQPEDSTYEEILQELSFVNMVNKGLDDSKKNNVVDNEELKTNIEKW